MNSLARDMEITFIIEGTDEKREGRVTHFDASTTDFVVLVGVERFLCHFEGDVVVGKLILE